MINILIAIDGACKRNGKPDCMSVGAAWIQTSEGDLKYRHIFETESTSQRGEINGLIAALKYAVEEGIPQGDIIIITDSQYIYNSVMLEWCYKWRDNGWANADGQETKNKDLWAIVCVFLDELNRLGERVFLEWTKGHMVHYTKGNIKKAMLVDANGIELFSRITTMANRPADRQNIINKFNKERNEHGCISVPENVALDWAIANATADGIAFYIVNTIYDATVI